jgi:hypothetical protein
MEPTWETLPADEQL